MHTPSKSEMRSPSIAAEVEPSGRPCFAACILSYTKMCSTGNVTRRSARLAAASRQKHVSHVKRKGQDSLEEHPNPQSGSIASRPKRKRTPLPDSDPSQAKREGVVVGESSNAHDDVASVAKDIEDSPLAADALRNIPTHDVARSTTKTLAQFYTYEQNVQHPQMEQRPLLDSLVATILSQATSNVNSSRAFNSMKKAFPDWNHAIKAGPSAIEESIRCGGLAQAKAVRIHQILCRLVEEHGKCSLEHLRTLPDDRVKSYLCSLPGVGPKTAACVLMFAMRRAEFPVDTHVRRIITRLGWLPQNFSAENVYKVMNSALPPEVKYDLHVLLIQHGRKTCGARNPKCSSCPLRDSCRYFSLSSADEDRSPSDMK